MLPPVCLTNVLHKPSRLPKLAHSCTDLSKALYAYGRKKKKKKSHLCVSMSACRTRANSFPAEEKRSAQSVYEGITPVPTFFCFFLSFCVPKAVASSPKQIASSPKETVQRRSPRGQCWEGHGVRKSLHLSASHYSSLSSSLTHGNS